MGLARRISLIEVGFEEGGEGGREGVLLFVAYPLFLTLTPLTSSLPPSLPSLSDRALRRLRPPAAPAGLQRQGDERSPMEGNHTPDQKIFTRRRDYYY